MSITKVLECKMTDSEKADLGKRLSDIQIKIQDLLDKKALIPKEIVILQEEVSKLAFMFRSGLITKEVECSWLLNIGDWDKTLVRLDTNEKIETVPMSWFDLPDSPETAFEMLTKSFYTPAGQGYLEFAPSVAVDVLKERFNIDRAKLVIQFLDSEFFMSGPGTVVIEKADFPKAIKHIQESFDVEIPVVDPEQKKENVTPPQQEMDTSYDVVDDEKIEIEED